MPRAVQSRAWVDFAKGVAIFLVVLYHASLFLDEFDLAGATIKIRSLLLFFPMPVFFFIAGLTAARSTSWTFPELWRRRLLPLVYLYLLWSAIRVVFYLFVPFRRVDDVRATAPLDVALIPVWPTSSYWFIWALAIFTFLVWALRRVPPAVQVSLAGALAVVSTTAGGLDFNNVGWDRVAQNFFFFVLAMFIPRLVHRLAARAKVVHAVALSAAYLGLVALIILFDARWIPAIVLLTSVTAVALGVAGSAVLVRIRWLGFVSALGRQSLQIYLLHLFVIVLIAWGVEQVAQYSVLQRMAPALPFLLAGVALVVSVLLWRVLRPVTWLWVSPFRVGRRRSRPSAPVRLETPPATGSPATGSSATGSPAAERASERPSADRSMSTSDE